MKAFEVAGFDTEPALVSRPLPEPKPGEVRLRIRACGLNFADLLMADGTYQDTPAPPFTLGMEVAGIVEALGQGVTEPAVGTRVAVYSGSGGLAEAGCFPAADCLVLPDDMPFEIASGFQIAYGTSYMALGHRARLAPGERLLVLGAAGGVGLTAVEIGKAMGAEVVAVARGPEKLEVARRAGADHLVDAGADDLVEKVKALGGADVVYDPVGGDLFKAAFRVCKPEARYLIIGFASGDVPRIPANIALVKNVTFMGFYWGGYARFDPDVLKRSIGEPLAMFAEGRLKPHVSHVLPLERAAEALDLLRSRRSTGKVVVTMPT